MPKRLSLSQGGKRDIRMSQSPRLRVLTAAAVRVDSSSRSEVRRQRAVRQNWQLDSFVYRNTIGEIRYAVNYLANCAARMRLFVAALPDDGDSDMPVDIADVPGVPPLLLQACNQAMRDLGNGRVALSNHMQSLSTNISLAGESYLLGQEDVWTGQQTWSVRSISEIVVYNDRIMLREGPVDSTGQLGLVPLDPNTTVISRMWQPDPQFRLLADSPMRAVLNECEALLILRRGIRAAGRSRLAGAGLLLLPDEVSIADFNDDNADPNADSFMNAFGEMMMTPITDEGDASAVVPGLLRGPGDALDKVRHLVMNVGQDPLALQVRQELVSVIATGLDLPKEVITGTADLNHWTAWQVDDNTFRHHVEPHVISLVDCLTDGFLRPYIQTCNIDPDIIAQWLPRLLFWYDPTELVTHPDRTANAQLAHVALAISDASYRDALGFDDGDAPDSIEIELRMIRATRTYPPNLMMALMHTLDPNLIVPPIETAGTIPGIDPAKGAIVGTPIPSTGVPVATPGLPVTTPAPPTPPTPPTPSTPGPPPATGVSGITAAALSDMTEDQAMIFRMAVDLTPSQRSNLKALLRQQMMDVYGIDPLTHWTSRNPTWGMTAAAPPVMALDARATPSARSIRLSKKLQQIDYDLRSRVQGAANSAMQRQLEKAGGRVWQKISANKDLREKVYLTRKDKIMATLGKATIEGMGMTAASLMETDWDDFKEQFKSWTKQAQENAVTTAAQLAGIDVDEAQTQASAAMSSGVEAGWTLLQGAMDTLAATLAYAPGGSQSEADAIAALNTDTLIPTGVVRAALAVVGGASPQDYGLIKTISGAEVPAIPLGSSVGGIGLGVTVQGLLTNNGATTYTYQWDHGPSIKPFDPHLELDGFQFTDFEDSALANGSDFPANQYYFPGDHVGSVIAGTIIEGSLAQALSLRWYEGDVIELTTASGQFLTVTPNHPVLTDHGWVSADLLREGDNVIRCLDAKGASRLGPDEHQVPAKIEELFATSWVTPSMIARAVPVAAEDFHGDGVEGQIAVVTTDGQLGRHVKAAFDEPTTQLNLIIASDLSKNLASASRPFEGLIAVGASSLGVEGEGCETVTFLGGAAGTEQELSIATATWRDTESPEFLGDRVAIHAESLSQSLDGLTGFIERDQLTNVNRLGGFSGHVFDLHTREQWYVANGIIAHNCLCDVTPLWITQDDVDAAQASADGSDDSDDSDDSDGEDDGS
jgi:hypothetical protein